MAWQVWDFGPFAPLVAWLGCNCGYTSRKSRNTNKFKKNSSNTKNHQTNSRTFNQTQYHKHGLQSFTFLAATPQEKPNEFMKLKQLKKTQEMSRTFKKTKKTKRTRNTREQ